MSKGGTAPLPTVDALAVSAMGTAPGPTLRDRWCRERGSTRPKAEDPREVAQFHQTGSILRHTVGQRVPVRGSPLGDLRFVRHEVFPIR